MVDDSENVRVDLHGGEFQALGIASGMSLLLIIAQNPMPKWMLFFEKAKSLGTISVASRV